MSARAETLPIGGRGNWSKWAAGVAVAVALAVAASLLISVMTDSRTAPPAPHVIPSQQIQAPAAPAYAPAAGFHAGGQSFLRLRRNVHLPNGASAGTTVAPNGEPVAQTTQDCQLCPR